jgi:glycosyltransferase involved in cell wall biosynthesis
MPLAVEQTTSRRLRPPALRPIRVLHVIPAFQMGGAERMLVDLFRTLEESADVEMQLCVLREPTYVYPEFAPRRGLRVLPFQSSWRSIGAVRECVRGLRVLIREFQPDVMHTHLWIAHYLGGLAAAGTQTPQLAHIHNTWDWMASPRAGFRIRRWVFRKVLQRSQVLFIACSDAAGRYYREHLRLQDAVMTTIPYGIDVDEFRPAGRDGASGDVLRIGTAGRFVPEKGHVDLLRAVAALRLEGHLCELQIAGEGPLENDYRRLVQEFGLDGHVQFCGRVEDMARFYRSLDVYVQPSWSAEGLPLSILEAMSSGCCVVASDVAGAVEAVEHGATGLVVRPRDVDGLAAALRRVSADPDMRNAMGRAARRKVVERFAVDTMCGRIEELYCEVAAR